MPREAAPADELAARIEWDLLEILLRRGRTGNLIQILAACATALLLFPQFPGAGVLASLCVVIGGAGLGLIVCTMFGGPGSISAGGSGESRGASERRATLARWLFLGACLITGCAWGSAAAFGVGFGAGDEIVLVLVLAGLMVLAAATLNASIPAFLLFSVPLAVPLSAGLLAGVTYGGGSQAAAVVLLLFLISACMAIEVHRGKRDHLRARCDLEAGREALLEANRNLEEARLSAQEAVEVKRRFTASLSHEIRTPMSGIIGITNLLLETDATEEQHQYLRMLKGSGESLLQLINDILDFSKIEAGRMQIERMDFELSDLLDSLVDQFAEQAARKGLEFVCVAEPEVPTRMKGDPGRLRQVLVNLVGNALKFTERGQVIVRVSRVGAGEGSVLVRFSVRDSGIGIPLEAQKLIFEPFTQAEASTSRRYGGTGLGLSIVRQIAALMNGRIELDSRPGEGSTFSLVTPLEVAEGEAPRPAAELSGVRSLVVDDNEMTRDFLEELLRSWGCRVEGTGSADQGLSMMRRAAPAGDPFRLVLMDMELPGTDGLAASREIREDRSLSAATVVMITGFGIRGDAARARKVGCAGFLTKPIKATHLQRVVLGALSMGPEGSRERIVTQYGARKVRTRKARILVVEDDPCSRRVAETLLRHRGHEVVLAETGREALTAIERDSFDLVLMDIEMPEMDGIEATRRLRSHVRGRDLPVIALTAHARAGTLKRFLEIGMNDLLVKPFQTADLEALLEKYIPASPMAASPAPPVMAAAPTPGATTGSPCSQASAAPAAVALAEVMDWEGALERHVDDESLLREVLGLFLESAPEQVARIEHAVDAGDATLLVREAHGLKGSAGMLGLVALSEAAGALEAIGRGGNLEGASDALVRLQGVASRAFGVIGALSKEGRGSAAEARMALGSK